MLCKIMESLLLKTYFYTFYVENVEEGCTEA
jgi:hypothetical protein